MLFTLYTSPVGVVISSFGIAHTHADDTQLYVALKGGSFSTLTDCIKALHHWLDLNGLCLNPEKTEADIVGTSERHRTEDRIDTIDTGSVHV